MKISIQAMKIAHGIKSQFTSFKAALIAAWKLIKSKSVTFAKEKTDEVRTAVIESFTTIEIQKGYARFVEILADGSKQFRSLCLDRLIIA